jgi:hypothetical protein
MPRQIDTEGIVEAIALCLIDRADLALTASVMIGWISGQVMNKKE